MLLHRKRECATLLLLLFSSVSPVVPQVFRALILLVFLMLVLPRVNSVKKQDLWVGAVAIVVFCTSLIQDLFSIEEYGLNTLSFLYIPLCFLSGYALSRAYSFEEYFYVYEKIIFLLALIALIFFVLIVVFPSIAYSFPEYSYYGYTAKSIIVLNVLVSDLGVIFRNCGFASEPGLYQFFLNLALWWRLKTRGRLDFHCFVFIISIFTTNSTAGIFGMFAVLFFGTRLELKVFIMLLMVVSIPILTPLVEYHLSNKWVGSASFDMRLTPFLNAFDFSFKQPFGIGAIEYTGIYKEMEIGGWDSFSQLVIRYGYQGLLLCLLLLTRLFKFGLVFLVLFFVALLSQNIWFLPIVSCFYFWGKTDFEH